MYEFPSGMTHRVLVSGGIVSYESGGNVEGVRSVAGSLGRSCRDPQMPVYA